VGRGGLRRFAFIIRAAARLYVGMLAVPAMPCLEGSCRFGHTGQGCEGLSPLLDDVLRPLIPLPWAWGKPPHDGWRRFGHLSSVSDPKFAVDSQPSRALNLFKSKP
jgi:hypothetical protein